MWLNVKLIHILGWADWRDPTPPPDATLPLAGLVDIRASTPSLLPSLETHPIHFHPCVLASCLSPHDWWELRTLPPISACGKDYCVAASIDIEIEWERERERERWRQPWQHLTPVLPASAHHQQQQHQAHANRWAHIRRPSCWEAAAAAALRWSPVWAAEWPAKSTLQRVEWCLCGRKGDAASGCPEGNRTASRCLRCPTWKAMTPPSLSCSFEPKM